MKLSGVYLIVCSSLMKLSGVYLIRNRLSGRVYVGSALDIKGRWFAHKSLLNKGRHHSRSMNRSWKKHGPSAFEFKVVEIVPLKENLVPREQYWIDFYKAAHPRLGFNMSPTAGNCLGCKHTKAAKEKMSKDRKGVPKSPQGAENIRRALLERNLSEEMRNKVRLSKIELYKDPERLKQLSRQSLAMWKRRRENGLRLGHSWTTESRLKLSIAKKGKMSLQHKAAIAASNKARVHRVPTGQLSFALF